jgi:predicted glycoside hydrolase/deacetylase ChbG (UPF0249 family)
MDLSLDFRLSRMYTVWNAGSAMEIPMESLAEGTAELMCHPGVYDDDLERAGTRLKRERERELEALSDPSLRRLAEEQGIELINYRELL